MRYYDVQRHWRKVKPVITSPEATRVLKRTFRYFESGVFQGTPADYDHGDWLLYRTGKWGKRGPRPAFFDFVCLGACHWLAHLNLFVTRAVAPNRAWRIVSSDDHSTVWDGNCLLFDLNFLALGITPHECLAMARGEGTPCST